MLLRIVLWSILIGSLVMGYVGIQTGSATNAIVGITVLIVAGFIIFFLLKLFLNFGFTVVKILLFMGIMALIIVSCIRGCSYLLSPNDSPTTPKQPEQVTVPNEGIISMEVEEPKSKSYFSKVVSFFKGSEEQKPAESSAPVPQATAKRTELPQTVSGTVKSVQTGYLFKIGKHFIKLYGIDTPDPKQKCIDKHGDSYDCGRQAKVILERMILGKKIDCRVVSGDQRGNYVATCKIRDIDIGAGMLVAGWAVAKRDIAPIYIPYEDDAHKKNLGLWAGRFVAPWEARTKQDKKGGYHTPSQKGFWENLF